MINIVACLGTETPFGLVIGFINHLQVVTIFTYYAIARSHNFQSLHASLFTLSVIVFIPHFTFSQADLLYSSVDLVPLLIFSERLAFT
jgi:hypothetical protein